MEALLAAAMFGTFALDCCTRQSAIWKKLGIEWMLVVNFLIPLDQPLCSLATLFV